jgi:dihydropteroate synthase
MVNDISALRMDPKMGKSHARAGVAMIMMHMQGRPRTMQRRPRYRDLMGDLVYFFRERLEHAVRCGIPLGRVLLDPGFGFGKTPAHNVELTDRLGELKVLGRPLVLGCSRKSTLGVLLGGLPPEERLEASLAGVVAGILRGADMVRVHDVKGTVRAARIADALRHGRGIKP